jgi:AcrR family transcriptional regulator
VADGLLPPSFETAWGLRGRAAKGPKPGLSVERIVHAAVQLASAEGIGAVSMGRVAAELGASTMSLYRYVAAKDELLALMVDAALGAPVPAAPGEDWRAGLTRWAWGFHDAMRRHPWALRVPVSGPPVTPNQVAWMEDALRALRDTGLAESAKASVLLLLSGYVRSEATVAFDIEHGFLAAADTPDQAMAGWASTLLRVTDDERFPALRAVLAAGVFDVADHPDDEFVFGLERLLDGVAALVSAAPADPAGP